MEIGPIVLVFQVPRPVSHMERDSLGPDIGSSHRGTGHVHPATSVHAAVMAEGTQSGEDEDLSSMRSNKNAESDLQVRALVI